ncbi:hypothetical protein AGMMS49982_04570 [Bacteroidia bacterium]|nr:hypothetical protein AGMMS49982_04570 [Bacteroidia bacterium]
MYCGIELKCPKCKERCTEMDDFCLHCGYPITDNAKKAKKNAEKKIMNKLKEEIKTLNEKLDNEKKSKKDLKNNLKKINAETQREVSIMPKWFYYLVSVVVGISLLVLILIIFNIL